MNDFRTYTVYLTDPRGVLVAQHTFANPGDAIYWASRMQSDAHVTDVQRNSDGAILWKDGEEQPALYTVNPALI